MNSNVLVGALAVGVIGVVALAMWNGDEDGEVMVDENVEIAETASITTLPADLPANIPLYPEAVVTKVQDIPADDARNVTLTLETPDSVADVNAWYRGALSDGVWAVTSDRNVGGYILLKGEADNVAVFTQAANLSAEGGAVITQRIQIK